MPNKKNSNAGVFTLLAGVAAGAVALFFSKKENREKTVTAVKKAEKKINQVSGEIKKDPKAFAKKVEKEGQKLASKVVKEVSKKAKSVQKTTAKAKKTAPIKAATAAKTAVTKAKKVAKSAGKKKATKTSSAK